MKKDAVLVHRFANQTKSYATHSRENAITIENTITIQFLMMS